MDEQPKCKPCHPLILDPIAKTTAFRKAAAELWEDIEKAYPSNKHIPRRVYLEWELKKKLLKERYNIDWKTPAELNPQIRFD
jgi:hypothetical protein